MNAEGGGDTGAPEVKFNPIPRDYYHTDWVADRTIAYLDSLDADEDWFVWMSFPEPGQHEEVCVSRDCQAATSSVNSLGSTIGRAPRSKRRTSAATTCGLNCWPEEASISRSAERAGRPAR